MQEIRLLHLTIKPLQQSLLLLQSFNQKDREYLLWHKSKARDYLEQDVKASLHKTMTLMEYHASRAEYKAFSRRVFQKHIYQEERKQRVMPLKVKTCNKLAEKKRKCIITHHDMETAITVAGGSKKRH